MKRCLLINLRPKLETSSPMRRQNKLERLSPVSIFSLAKSLLAGEELTWVEYLTVGCKYLPKTNTLTFLNKWCGDIWATSCHMCNSTIVRPPESPYFKVSKMGTHLCSFKIDQVMCTITNLDSVIGITSTLHSLFSLLIIVLALLFIRLYLSKESQASLLSLNYFCIYFPVLINL